MKIFLLICLLFVSLSALSKDQWGEITLEKPLTLTKAIQNLTEGKKDEVLIKAKVGKVCTKKGCWMTLKSQESDIRVTFKNYSLFVPLNIIDKNVLVQGILSSHELTVAEAKHLANDAGENPAKIRSPVKEYRIVSTGVKLIK